MHRRALLCLIAILATGCRKAPQGPDANYQKASTIYQQLYATQLDDAYADPGMDAVVALLKKVNPDSIDAESAKAMLGSITRGREELAKQRARRDQMAAAAAASAANNVINFDPSAIVAASNPVDAGPPVDPFGPGASILELNTTVGGCLSAGEPFREQGTDITGTVYRLAKSQTCGQKAPGLVGQMVLVVNGKIYRRMQEPPPPPPPPAPDAGPAAVAPSPPARAAVPVPAARPPGAGESTAPQPATPPEPAGRPQ